MQIIKEPLFYEDGRVRGIIALINNVREQEQLRRKLREQSITDRMTGVYNCSYYQEYVQQLEEHMAFPMGIIAADCDNLKTINDTHGHMVGDEYIRMCVMLLRVGLTERSVIFRIGGDEFVVFVPETTDGEMRKVLDSIRENAATYQVKGRQLSISLGYSLMKSQDDDFAEHLKISDTNMYEDKKRRKGSHQ